MRFLVFISVRLSSVVYEQLNLTRKGFELQVNIDLSILIYTLNVFLS